MTEDIDPTDPEKRLLAEDIDEDARDTLEDDERLDLADEPELISADLDSLENPIGLDDIDREDNPFNASDEALPEEGEERELLRDPSGEATRFGERVQ